MCWLPGIAVLVAVVAGVFVIAAVSLVLLRVQDDNQTPLVCTFPQGRIDT